LGTFERYERNYCRSPQLVDNVASLVLEFAHGA